MVGRRYRDIIEAADNIKQMKMVADSVLQNLRDVQQSFNNLQTLQNRMISKSQTYKLAVTPAVDPGTLLNAKLQLISSLPEEIWKCLDDERVFEAAWYFLIADQLYHSITLHSDGSRRVASIANRWNLLNRLKCKIVEVCLEKLAGRRSLSGSSASELISTILLLENLSLADVLAKFLKIREAALVMAWKDATRSNKQQLEEAVALMLQTMLIVDEMFSSASEAPAQAFVKLQQVFAGVWIPDQFTNGRGKVFESLVTECCQGLKITLSKNSLVCLPREVIQGLLGEWTRNAVQLLETNGRLMLKYCDSLTAVISLKQACVELTTGIQASTSSTWPDVCSRVLGTLFLPWEHVLCAVFSARTKELIFENTQQIMQNFVDGTEDFLERQLAVQWSAGASFASFLWSDLSTDLATVETSSGISSNETVVTTLKLKAKGYNMAVYRLAQKLNAQLELLRTSLKDYAKCTSSLDEAENESIFKGLSDASLDATASLVASMEAKLRRTQAKLDEMPKEAYAEKRKLAEQFVFCAKLCLCCCDMCPALALCLVRTADAKSDDRIAVRQASVTDSSQWTAARNKLSACANEGLTRWLFVVIESVGDYVRRSVSDFQTGRLQDGVQTWDFVEIEEESEEGRKVKSRLEVPVQCSFGIQQFLFSLCAEVNAVCAHSFPRSVLNCLLYEALLCCVNQFEAFVAQCARQTTQKIAIQMLFDVKVLANLLAWRPAAESEKAKQAELAARCKLLTDVFESCIDPFDLDVLSPHIKHAINRFTVKALQMFGCLLPQETQTFLSRLPVSKQSSESERAQIMPLAAGSDRFQLLPVPTDHSQAKQAMIASSFSTSASASTLLQSSALNSADAAKQRLLAAARPQTQQQSVASSLIQKSSSFYDRISTGWFGM